MRLSKFSHCNRMSVAELARLFARQDDRAAPTGIDLRCMAAWMSKAIASLLEISAEHVQASFCCAEPHVLTMRACSELRCCVSCLQAGFHTAWFQWLVVERCPLHDAPLRTGYVRCAAAIPYALGAQPALSPLSRVGVNRPPGVGIYRPLEAVPKGISRSPVNGVILPG